MMYGLYNGYGGGIMMILFWVLAIIFIIWIVREISDKKIKSDEALEILKERYARGEINKKEFKEKKKDLNN
ncbi:MAG: electron transporter RnfE [Candidatus Liptonbacteria bacterium CG11_big_fil_rev_8_21_14_0_20_35_14]|uniref:Electron transporter RnfE n=1 Tax=Candidatus Liptonbacteria bacterium CG11_big_fil_rev_8_21_14_0_20_35_14 TaxID=1974634 RepID=A0A2H0N752_9BACT|nr:MAG: electron transporter RnfE [Candidatus Liptonbacteria bacterium CG11_big_fil_rev_8_21_14_0_20_35_14]